MPTQIFENTAFIHVPKTGGTCISALFPDSQLFITKYLNLNDVEEKDHYFLLHAPANLVKLHEPNLKMIIGFVRNPYTRFISIFCMSKGLGVHDYSISIPGIIKFCNDFRKSSFSKNIIFKPMSFFLCNDSVCIADHIFYFENFDNSIKTISKLCGFEIPSEITCKNDNLLIHRDQYKKWYKNCPLLYDFVNDIYKDDFKYFDYKIIKSN